MPNAPLAKPVAMVTGGASGIGRATCELLADDMIVLVADIDGDGANDVAAGLRDGRGVAMDVSQPGAVAEVVDRVITLIGPPTVLVNAAGWDRITRFVDSDPAFWNRVLDINLRGPIAVTHAVLPGMIEAGGGSIVNIASDAGRVGSSGEVVYSAAKGGLIAFTKALAKEVARHSIRVNCVAPGPTQTPFLEIFDDESVKILDAMKRLTPLRKFATPADIAQAVGYFVSATHVTGQTLSVSGGLTMV